MPHIFSSEAGPSGYPHLRAAHSEGTAFLVAATKEEISEELCAISSLYEPGCDICHHVHTPLALDTKGLRDIVKPMKCKWCVQLSPWLTFRIL